MTKKNLTQVLCEFRSFWGNRFDYSEVEYVNTNTKVKIGCYEHGSFELYPWQHKKGVGCYRCGRAQIGAKVASKLKSNSNDFIIKAKKIFGDRYDYSKVAYTHSHQKVTIVCVLHGDFMLAPSRHLERQGCPTCSSQKSNLESLWLDSLGLPRDQAHRNFDLKLGGRKCMIDGYDPNTNTVYEFNGDFWHGNPKIYEPTDIHPLIGKSYGELYRLTLEKEERIKSAGYNLVTMWESDWKD